MEKEIPNKIAKKLKPRKIKPRDKLLRKCIHELSSELRRLKKQDKHARNLNDVQRLDKLLSVPANYLINDKYNASNNFQSNNDNLNEKLFGDVEVGTSREQVPNFEDLYVSDSRSMIDDYSSEEILQTGRDDDSSCDDELGCRQIFLEKLRKCFVDINIPHNHGKQILHVLRTHECFSFIPRDTRTLLKTCHDKIPIFSIGSGEDLQLGFETAVETVLLRPLITDIPNLLDIDLSTDGVRVDKAGHIQLWPFQCRIANFQSSTPEFSGIYRGSSKSSNAMAFFSQFISELNSLKDK